MPNHDIVPALTREQIEGTRESQAPLTPSAASASRVVLVRSAAVADHRTALAVEAAVNVGALAAVRPRLNPVESNGVRDNAQAVDADARKTG